MKYGKRIVKRIPFKSYLHDLISRRTIEIGSGLIVGNSEYCELSAKSSALYHRINGQLSVEAQGLLDEYESTLNLMGAISDDVMYKQGLRDGVSLRRLLAQPDKYIKFI